MTERASDREASRTARMVAAFRGRAGTEHGDICHDPWAAALAGEDGESLADRYLSVFPNMVLYMAIRTAFIDGLLRAFCRGDNAIEQVVLLGAGLDSRAARLRLPRPRFFEVDHPNSQNDKIARLRGLRDYPVSAATYVSCDFEREDFLERLEASGFRSDKPAFFVWEGVTYYLSEEAVRSTLARVSSATHRGSLIVFDYVRKRLVSGDARHERTTKMRSIVADLGEPLRFGTDDPLPMLYECGFRYVRTSTFDEACLLLTGTYERERELRFQSLALASVSVPWLEPAATRD